MTIRMSSDGGRTWPAAQAIHEAPRWPCCAAARLGCCMQTSNSRRPAVVFNGYDEVLAPGLLMSADGGIGAFLQRGPGKVRRRLL